MPVELTIKTIASTNVRRFTLDFPHADYDAVLALLDPFEKAEVESCLQPESTVHEKLIALEIMARRLYEKELVRPPVRSGWQSLVDRIMGDGDVRVSGGAGTATAFVLMDERREIMRRLAENNRRIQGRLPADAITAAAEVGARIDAPYRDAERIQRMNRLRAGMASDITRPTHHESVRRQDLHIAEMAARRVETVQEELGREAIILTATEGDFLGELYAQIQRCNLNGDVQGVTRAARDADATIARIRSDRSARDSTRFRRSEWISDGGPVLPPPVAADAIPVSTEPVVSVAVSVPPPVVAPRPGIQAAISAQAEYDSDEERARQESEERARRRVARGTVHDRAEAYLNARGQSLQTVSGSTRDFILERARRGALPPYPREPT